jgi:GH25 family lysozyme M1 (1,4-beta-N-acetylmuramidase)
MGQGLQRLEAGLTPQTDISPDKLDELVRVESGSAAVPPEAGTSSAVTPMAGSWRPPGIQGMDVSNYQGNVDWPTAWAQGARFAYVKASEGTFYTNPSFSQQYSGSTAVGMYRGAYHFAMPTLTSGREQANFFVDHGGSWSSDGRTLPPLLDIEYNPYDAKTMPSGEGDTCYAMSPVELISWIRDFSNTIKARTGRIPMIYTATNWWNYCIGDTTAFADHPLHIAAYNEIAAGPVPYGWKTYSFWQYSDSGPFVGDSNVWNGSAAGLAAFVKGVAPAPAPDTAVRQFNPGDFNGDGRPDLVNRRVDGTLWLHPGQTDGKFGTPIRIGTGFQAFNLFLATGDYDGDGRNDFLARHVDGSLWRYSGTGIVDSTSEGYRPGQKIGASGWNSFLSLTSGGDYDGNGTADLLGFRSDGSLWLYPGPGNGQHGSGHIIGSGWNVFKDIAGAGDFDADGKDDLLARSSDGRLVLYRGDGNGDFLAGEQIGTGWHVYTQVLGSTDFNGDRRPDLLGVRSDQSLWFYAGTGFSREGYLPALRIPTDLLSHDEVTAVGNFDSEGGNDLISRSQDGKLWFHAGTGQNEFSNQVEIGHGWHIYQDLIGVTDLNSDGQPDLLAIRPDGTLWFYAGTGSISASSEGYRPGVRIGSGWNIYSELVTPGDYNGDGRADLLGRRPDGTLWFYAGTGSISASSEGYAPARQIGRGWDGFRQIVGSPDLGSDGKNDMVAILPDGRVFLYRGDAMNDEGYRVPTASGRL